MLLPKIWIICRACLKQHEEMYDIFQDAISIHNIWEILRDCGGAPVRKNDDLPDKICLQCLKKLWKCNKFRLQCQSAHREIAQMLLDRDHSKYEQELEVEREACSDMDVDMPSRKESPETITIDQKQDHPETVIYTESNAEERHEIVKSPADSEKDKNKLLEFIEHKANPPETVTAKVNDSSENNMENINNEFIKQQKKKQLETSISTTTYTIIEPVEQNDEVCIVSNVQIPQNYIEEQCLDIKEDADVIVNDTNEMVKSEETETISISDDDVNHYCVVKNEALETDQQERIVLLLKLKNKNTTTTATTTTSKTPNSKTNNSKTTLPTTSKTNNSNRKIKTENRKTMKLRKCMKKNTKAHIRINFKPKIKTKIIPKSRRKTTGSNIKKEIKTSKKHSILSRSTFKCQVCNKRFDTNVLLRHHSYTHNNPHTCKICGKKFSQVQSYINHFNTHVGDKPYHCRFCDNKFNDVTNRNSHERAKHKSENKEHKCEKCGKNFRFLSLLEKHSNVHKSRQCLICDKVFATLQVLRRHHEKIHLKSSEQKKEVK